jgi:hypothetical protein
MSDAVVPDYDAEILEGIREVLEEYDNGNLDSEKAVMRIFTIGEL